MNTYIDKKPLFYANVLTHIKQSMTNDYTTICYGHFFTNIFIPDRARISIIELATKKARNISIEAIDNNQIKISRNIFFEVSHNEQNKLVETYCIDYYNIISAIGFVAALKAFIFKAVYEAEIIKLPIQQYLSIETIPNQRQRYRVRTNKNIGYDDVKYNDMDMMTMKCIDFML